MKLHETHVAAIFGLVVIFVCVWIQVGIIADFYSESYKYVEVAERRRFVTVLCLLLTVQVAGIKVTRWTDAVLLFFGGLLATSLVALTHHHA